MKLSQYRIVKTIKVGEVSGATIALCQNGSSQLYVLKTYEPGNMRVPLSSEVENRHKLAEYWSGHLPVIHGWSEEDEKPWVLMESISKPHLLNAAINEAGNTESVTKVTEHILESLVGMWRQSKTTTHSLTRDPNTRALSVEQALKTVFAELGIKEDDFLVVNGNELGKVSALLMKMFSKPADFSVFCHGDPNPENYLVDLDNLHWWSIDYDRVGWHDWRLSLSHFIGWWTSSGSNLEHEPLMSRTKNRLELDYELGLPQGVAKLQRLGRHYAEVAAEELQDHSWEQSLQAYLGAFYLGEARFLSRRNRSQFLLPLLGEGFSALSD